MKRIPFVILLLLSACGSDTDADLADATVSTPDAADTGAAPDAAAVFDATPTPDANLTDHVFVDIDGVRFDFEEVLVVDGGAGSRTVSGGIGDCPFSTSCTQLFISIAQTTPPGFYSCDDINISVQFSDGFNSYFSFGSTLATCSFRVDVNDGSTVAISSLNARVEKNNDPKNFKRLVGGEARGSFF